MSDSLEVITSPEKVSERLDSLRSLRPEETRAPDAVLLCKLGSGILRFANTIFPGAPLDKIYAEKYTREPEGRGAHFDVYDETVNPEFPWLGVYNLYGNVAVSVAKLPEDLASIYFQRFPEPNDDAFKARRHFTAIALATPDVTVYKGTLSKDTGMVILQRPSGPNIIHNVVPEDRDVPGEFIKIVCPSDSKEAQALIAKTHLMPLDELITQELRDMQNIGEDEGQRFFEDGAPDLSLLDIATPPKIRPRSLSAHALSPRPKPKAPCNLD